MIEIKLKPGWNNNFKAPWLVLKSGKIVSQHQTKKQALVAKEKIIRILKMYYLD